MSAIEFLSQPIWQRIGLTLLHFVWQGLAIAILILSLIHLFRLKRGTSRYAAYLVAFALMMACPIVTFLSHAAASALTGRITHPREISC